MEPLRLLDNVSSTEYVCFRSFGFVRILPITVDPLQIVCPQCRMETQLSVHLGIDSLLSDFGLESVMHRQLSFDDKVRSTTVAMG